MDTFSKCIQQCQTCHRVCLETLNYCLQMEGRHRDPNLLRLLLDCADICHVTANFLMRNSPHHDLTCGICADICNASAQELETFEEDQTMLGCAYACRSCAQACEETTMQDLTAAVEGEELAKTLPTE